MEDWESGTFSVVVVIGAFLRFVMAENQIRQHLFFRHFLAPYMLFFNNRNIDIMIEPI